MAFGALPLTVTERYFRGDSGCHERELLQWLNSPDRALRQWTDVDHLPSEPYESKADNGKPLRFVGLRLLRMQGLLFANRSDRKHFGA
jgi:hypothetical protein